MGFVRSAIKTIIFAYVARVIYLFLVNHGVGVHYNDVKPGPCRIVPGISCGSEQISVTNDGLAFITSGQKSTTHCNRKYVKGRIYLFDFNKPDENVTELKIESEVLDIDLFEPLGMDILDENEKVKIFVINYAPQQSIEIFHFDNNDRGALKHVQTVTNKKFVCLDDIAVVSEKEFYITNYVKFCEYPPILMTEYFLQLPTSNIVYYNYGESTVVTSGESFLNGITLTKDKMRVFTVSTRTGHLLEYSRSRKGTLSLVNRHYIGFHPDNVFLDQATGFLYASTQKAFFAQMLFSGNQTDHCPATGTKIIQNSSGNIEVEEILHVNGGEFVNSLSTVAHYKGQYLFGTLHDSLGYCIDRSVISIMKTENQA